MYEVFLAGALISAVFNGVENTMCPVWKLGPPGVYLNWPGVLLQQVWAYQLHISCQIVECMTLLQFSMYTNV